MFAGIIRFPHRFHRVSIAGILSQAIVDLFRFRIVLRGGILGRDRVDENKAANVLRVRRGQVPQKIEPTT